LPFYLWLLAAENVRAALALSAILAHYNASTALRQ